MNSITSFRRSLRGALAGPRRAKEDRKSTRLNSSHDQISYAVFCLKKKKNTKPTSTPPSRLHPEHKTNQCVHALPHRSRMVPDPSASTLALYTQRPKEQRPRPAATV